MAGKLSPTLLQMSGIVGGCRIERFIGRGGMGEVYLAEHLTLQKPVAVKVLPPSRVDREHVHRFLREARTCSRIEHPNVVTVYDVGEEKGVYYIVMQYVDGKNLSEVIEVQGGPLPWRMALKILRMAAKGVGAVHDSSLIHRDIKPSNIMVSQGSQVYLMDFGLVRDESPSAAMKQSQVTLSGQIVGTPAFMSPEQCNGQSLDRRSDIYSLGATLYFLLTGQCPFSGGTHAVLAQVMTGQRPPAVRDLNQYVPQDVSDLVAKAMAIDVHDRYADTKLLIQSMNRLLRKPETGETPGHETSNVSAMDTAPHVVPLLKPLELIPTESVVDSQVVLWRWLMGAGALVLLLTLSLVLRAVFGADEASESVQHSIDPSQTAANADSVPPNPKTMVTIPAGHTQLGSDPARLRNHLQAIDELKNDLQMQVVLAQLITFEPMRRVKVAEFSIDKYEVTNAEYAKFVAATGHRSPVHWEGKRTPPQAIADHPVTHVSHDDASTYAAWAGKKLPTLAQWVRAFRGDSTRFYPWGNDMDMDRANVGENDRFFGTSAVTDTPRDVSSLGVFNLAGNVSEIIREKRVLAGQVAICLKGADWNESHGRIHGLASSGRLLGPAAPLETSQNQQIGFRCVIEAEEEN